MKKQAIVITICALFAGIFLADNALHLRYCFPAESLGRNFFFNFWIDAAALISSAPALYSYISAFKGWNKAEKSFYGFLAAIPVLNLLWLVASAVLFVAHND